MSKEPRLKRLFSKAGNCFDVAIDHGMFNEASFLNGISDIEKAVKTVVEANPDAIQLPPGSARVLQAIEGKQKPSLVLRTDIANCYGAALPEYLMSEMIDQAVEQAIVLDAACIVVNILQLPNQPELHAKCVANANSLKRECEIYGMPLMIEPLVMQANNKSGGYMVDGDINKILPLVRQASELGADIIKADPCDNVDEYNRVIEVARVPLLVRGGGRASDDEIFNRTVKLMQQGAKGIVYGRNVIQHDKPKEMTQALMAIVHDQADVDQALEILKG
ncbi:MAG: aldolase [Planctomycetota bacterium]|nr:MAG: aldolase [Planctomycetota bacterium]